MNIPEVFNFLESCDRVEEVVFVTNSTKDKHVRIWYRSDIVVASGWTVDAVWMGQTIREASFQTYGTIFSRVFVSDNYDEVIKLCEAGRLVKSA